MFAASSKFLPFFAEGGFPLPLIIGMAAIWIFIFILPMRKEKKRKAEMMAGLKKGDRLLFQNGLIGKLVNDKGNTLIVDSQGSKFEILRDQIVKVIDEKAEASA